MGFGRKALSKARQSGASATRGFLGGRINAIFGGSKDVLVAGKDFTVNTIGTGHSKGSPGALGVAADTFDSVVDTLSWNSPRGILNLSTTSINPLASGREWMLNPFHHARKLAAGVTELAAEAVGGTIGIISDRIGNLARGVIRGGSRAVGGVFLGDYGEHLSEASRSNVGTQAVTKAESGAKQAASAVQQAAAQPAANDNVEAAAPKRKQA